MQYQEAVAEAHRLDTVIEEAESTAEEAKWARADLAWQQVQAGVSRRQWARDTGKDHSTIVRWVQMVERWPSGVGGHRPAFERAMLEVKGFDPDESSYERDARTAIRNMPPEQKAAVVREALDDQDVATRVMRDPHTSSQVSHAREQVWREQADDAKAREHESPTQREAARTVEHFEVGNHLRLSRFHAAEAARQLQDIEDRDDAMVRGFQRDAQEVRDALDWFEVVARGGKIDDDALVRFLEGGDA